MPGTMDGMSPKDNHPSDETVDKTVEIHEHQMVLFESGSNVGLAGNESPCATLTSTSTGNFRCPICKCPCCNLQEDKCDECQEDVYMVQVCEKNSVQHHYVHGCICTRLVLIGQDAQEGSLELPREERRSKACNFLHVETVPFTGQSGHLNWSRLFRHQVAAAGIAIVDYNAEIFDLRGLEVLPAWAAVSS